MAKELRLRTNRHEVRLRTNSFMRRFVYGATVSWIFVEVVFRNFSRLTFDAEKCVVNYCFPKNF